MAEDGSALSRQTRRLELRAENLKAWETGGSDSEETGSLDSSLKRNTAFIKRLRTSLQASDSIAALLKEVRALSLGKYVSELVAATVEGLSRCKSGVEIAGATEVISALHQRFPDLFSVPLAHTLHGSLQPPSKAALAASSGEQREKDEGARVLRQRGLLRIYAELELIAVLKPDKKGHLGDATFQVLKDLLTADKDLIVISIPLAVAFTKHLGTTFLPPANVSASDGLTPAEAQDVDVAVDTVSIAQQDKFRKLLSAYYDALCRRAIKDHTHLLETDRRNHDAYIRSGEIFEDRAQTYEKMAKNWEKLWTGVQSLSESLHLPLPTLPPLASNTIVTGTGVGASLLNTMNAEDGIGGAGSVWMDDEDKRFYTDLLDLKGEVPGQFLKISEKDKEVIEEKLPTESEAEVDGMDDIMEEDAEPPKVAEPEPDDGLAPAPAAQLSALFARLPDMSSRDTIDKAAVEFTFLNSKAARRRLVKLVAGVPRTRQDLIPYYARLVATLHQYMPDVGSGVVALLEDEFRYLYKRKMQDLAETRAKNIRFLSELTKFGVTPSHSILHVLKVCLDDFSTSSIDNICNLLESCGRFLLRSEATRERTAGLLDTLKRKKGVANLDQRQITMIENAYYQCDPADRPVVVPKERTPMQLYIRHLLYDVLAKATLEKVVKALRRLHWEEPEVRRKLYNAFTKVWKIKFSNVYLFAILLHDLARHHSDFCVQVVDGVLENITVGMEHNNFKQNQQRVATVKYLGELYTYRVVDSKVVLDTLWLLVTFGHPEGRPTPDNRTPLDTADDFFRIRLVCTLLDTCGVYFDRGLLRRKMDNFFTFFQMYVKTKNQQPMDIDFMLSDTFETLRPKMAIFKTFDEAASAVDEMFAAIAMAPIEPEVEQEPELDLSDIETAKPLNAGERSEDEVEPEEPEQDEVGDDSSSSESESSVTSSEDEEDEEFERDLARMMADTSERKAAPTAKSTLSTLALPSFRKEKSAEDDQNMKFTLLMKKGSKQQTRSMDVPRTSALAAHTLSKQEESRAEQEHLKKLVLNYERREEAESRKEWVDSAAERGFRIRFKG